MKHLNSSFIGNSEIHLRHGLPLNPSLITSNPQSGAASEMNLKLLITIYEARTPLELGVSQCQTHVVSNTDMTPTHIIILNYIKKFKLLTV